jgi:hypothetical protein
MYSLREQDERREKLALITYQQAQQSAEHHDTLLWEVTYIVWGSTTLLLGFVLEAIKTQPRLCFVTAVLSIFVTIMVLVLALSFRKVRNVRWKTCHQIESDLGMQWLHRKKITQEGVQTRWYVATTLALIVTWLFVICESAHALGLHWQILRLCPTWLG